ncbi:hypothetical protein GBA65_14725 [Rubrobacter marinus]|uniref:Uncharacterized protein n=1 Tax=Rubrobacter marinus TaxID=2653852 RepID=A0A6G8PZF1_9ACTN|nr:hypothetical protein [Rubrobacter marinus]QIN79565.1 hypothetical protein GBA65_14725 [Rubrobacter marinus]
MGAWLFLTVLAVALTWVVPVLIGLFYNALRGRVRGGKPVALVLAVAAALAVYAGALALCVVALGFLLDGSG